VSGSRFTSRRIGLLLSRRGDRKRRPASDNTRRKSASAANTSGGSLRREYARRGRFDPARPSIGVQIEGVRARGVGRIGRHDAGQLEVDEVLGVEHLVRVGVNLRLVLLQPGEFLDAAGRAVAMAGYSIELVPATSSPSTVNRVALLPDVPRSCARRDLFMRPPGVMGLVAGVLHQDNGFFDSGKIRIWGVHFVGQDFILSARFSSNV